MYSTIALALLGGAVMAAEVDTYKLEQTDEPVDLKNVYEWNKGPRLDFGDAVL